MRTKTNAATGISAGSTRAKLRAFAILYALSVAAALLVAYGFRALLNWGMR